MRSCSVSVCLHVDLSVYVCSRSFVTVNGCCMIPRFVLSPVSCGASPARFSFSPVQYSHPSNVPVRRENCISVEEEPKEGRSWSTRGEMYLWETDSELRVIHLN